MKGKRKKYRATSQKNPWRNTRNDKDIPWRNIGAFVFMLLIPIMVICLASNIVMRYDGFFAFFMSKTEVVREIPYAVEKEDLSKTFSDYMQHKTKNFQLTEKQEYNPQKLFTERNDSIMHMIRKILDILLVIGTLALIGCVSLFIFVLRSGEKSLIFNRYLDSLVILGVLLIGDVLVFAIPEARALLFREFFGVKFLPGDVLIQIFQKNLALYFLVGQLIVCAIIVIAMSYIVYKFASRRKMFRKVEI